MSQDRNRRTNAEIAAVFSEMADLLELSPAPAARSTQESRSHRIRAFRRAAATIQMLPQAAALLLRQGRLASMRGIGEGTTHRIKQILRKGTCDDHQALRQAVPPRLAELLKLRGLGPAKIRLIHQHLGVSSVDELEQALTTGQVARLPRIGEQSVQAIAAAITDYRRHTERIPLARALAIGETIVEELSSAAGVYRACQVGSARRFKETVGDLDFLAAADDPQHAVAQFCATSPMVQIISQGESIASCRIASGHQADLWVVEPRCLGAGLHAYSGCQPHVVSIRDRAGRRGLHISEHGITSRSTGKRLSPAEDESEIFEAVGLPFIAPELREACGELQAAENDSLPCLVTATDLRGDLHLHTNDSDGTATIEQMAVAAIERGLDYIAVTDHSKALAVANGLDEQQALVQKVLIDRTASSFPTLMILWGIEVDILDDGRLDLELGLLAQMDWVVASIHANLNRSAEVLEDRLIKAMQSGVVDCIGHPTGRRLGRRDSQELNLDRIFRAAADLNVAMELNCNPGRLDLDSVSCRRARDLGVDIVVNSDAHSSQELKTSHRLGVGVARRGWLEPQHILNTQPAAVILERRRRRLQRCGLTARLSTAAADVADPAVPGHTGASANKGTPAPGSNEVEELACALSEGVVDADLRQRLQRFLEGGEPLLAQALAKVDENPVQFAFNLLMRANKP